MNQLFKNNQLAKDVFTEKYALPGETPAELFNRITNQFYNKELERFNNLDEVFIQNNKKHLSEYGKYYVELVENKTKLKERFLDLFSDFKYIIPGGSVLSTLGTDKLSSLSNCFVISSPEDSISGIFEACNEQSQLMKYRGGVGIDISSLRPSNATVQNSAKTSSGSASFADLFSQVTNTIGQNNRRGALMLSISINHPDVEEFILVKQDLTKVTGANMSVKVTNEFMEAVENNEDYILTYPIDQRLKPSDVEEYKEYNKLYPNPYGPGFFKRIKALELWNKLIHCAWNTAEPGIIFEDHHNNYSPDSVYEDYKFVTTNPCLHPDTLIRLDDGSQVKIQDIKVGDYVKSINLEEKCIEYKKVTFSGKTKSDANIILAKIDNTEIKCTKDHKFYDFINKCWSPLYVGMSIGSFESDPITKRTLFKVLKVKSIKDAGKSDVYDITVEDNHNFLITENNILSHNCGEIAMQPYDSCRLLHHNLTSFIVGKPFTNEARIDCDLAYYLFYHGMILGDILVDLEIDAINKIIDKISKDETLSKKNRDTELALWNKIINSANSTRRTGIGFTGLADMLAMLNLSYTDKKALESVEKLMNIKQKAELNATIDLAILFNTFKGYDCFVENNSFFDHIKQEFPDEYSRMLQFGRRNLSFSTVAPTGSISILTQTSSGIEPVFLPFYQRKRKITNENDKVDFIDKVGVKYTTYNVIHKPLMDWILLHDKNVTEEDLLQMPIEKLQIYFEDSPWYKNCASDINYINRLKMQSVIQKYTTHSISSTLNLPKETKDSVIDNIYREAYKLNLKGVTIYRDGSRDGILTSINTKPTSTAFLETKAPKRPTSLPAKLDIVTIKGQPFAIIVGLYENKPYEVFAFKLTDPSIKECTGIIKKKAKKVYDFSSEDIYIPNLELSYESIEEKAFTLYTSMSLRHGVNIKYIIKTLNKVDENITSFAKALNRVLSKYIPKETTDELCPECSNTLVREAGCIKCLHCSYSRC